MPQDQLADGEADLVLDLMDIVKGGGVDEYHMETMMISFEAELSVFRRNRIPFPYNRESGPRLFFFLFSFHLVLVLAALLSHASPNSLVMFSLGDDRPSTTIPFTFVTVGPESAGGPSGQSSQDVWAILS